jgi:hypothetical protein
MQTKKAHPKGRLAGPTLDLATTKFAQNGLLLMRSLLVAASTLLFLVSAAFGFADFSGKWVPDLRASSSSHAMLQRLGASWVERRFGSSLQMEANYTQTSQAVTVARQGFGFQKTDVIRTDDQPEIQGDSLLGRYTIRSHWSDSGTQLISEISFRTKDSRDAQMTVVRELADGGKTLIWSGTLKIAGESRSWVVRRVWRKG